jgi:gliding motility-associated lipoprotein GldH
MLPKLLEILRIKGKITIEEENLKAMRNSIPAILFFMFLASCNSGPVVGETRSLTGTWNKEQSIEFQIPQLDSLRNYNVFLNVRNSNEYKFNNLFLLVSIDFPHGKTVIDTLEYRLAKPDGTWLGTGLGSIKENKFWYKENVSFKEEGIYKLTIAQAVRNNGEVDGVTDLVGITDVGFSVEEVNK